MRVCELRQKEVINIRDGQRMGYVADIEFDETTGCICQIIVPGPGKFCGLLGRDIDYTIGWKCIHHIGHDVILVDVHIPETRKKADGDK